MLPQFRLGKQVGAEVLDARDFIIINNACQTVRRPPEFYRHMMETETAALHTGEHVWGKFLKDYQPTDW